MEEEIFHIISLSVLLNQRSVYTNFFPGPRPKFRYFKTHSIRNVLKKRTDIIRPTFTSADHCVTLVL